VLSLDRRGKRVELRRVMNSDFKANFVASSFHRALGRLDRLLDLSYFRKRTAELRVECALGQQIVSALRDAGIFRGQRISG
jgi:hypothetical protein